MVGPVLVALTLCGFAGFFLYAELTIDDDTLVRVCHNGTRVWHMKDGTYRVGPYRVEFSDLDRVCG